METPASAKFENKNKMADSHFAISNQSNVERLKENSKNKNTLKVTETWLKVWQNWAKERKVNQKIEEYEHEELNKMLQLLKRLHCIVKNIKSIINKKLYEFARAFLNLRSLVMFRSFQIALALGSYNVDALAFIQFSIQIISYINHYIISYIISIIMSYQIITLSYHII